VASLFAKEIPTTALVEKWCHWYCSWNYCFVPVGTPLFDDIYHQSCFVFFKLTKLETIIQSFSLDGHQIKYSQDLPSFECHFSLGLTIIK
jgi:hypothetical protein